MSFVQNGQKLRDHMDNIENIAILCYNNVYYKNRLIVVAPKKRMHN